MPSLDDYDPAEPSADASEENNGRALHRPEGTGIRHALSTREIVMSVRGEVRALSAMLTAFIDRKPAWMRIAWVLAENKNGQLKFVALIVLGLAALVNGVAISAFGVSIAGAAEMLP